MPLIPLNPLIGHDKNGRDWKLASVALRHDFCDFHAAHFTQKLAPISGTELFDALGTFFETESEGILQMTLISAMSLVLSAKYSSR
jgi:hypothetical protein